MTSTLYYPDGTIRIVYQHQKGISFENAIKVNKKLFENYSELRDSYSIINGRNRKIKISYKDDDFVVKEL